MTTFVCLQKDINNSHVYFQANCSTSFIKDLIDHLKSTHELKIFNFEVQKRFHNHVKLLKEMKLLQKRYAVNINKPDYYFLPFCVDLKRFKRCFKLGEHVRTTRNKNKQPFGRALR